MPQPRPGNLSAAEWLIADRGYDADWFRDALKHKRIRPCVPAREFRGRTVRYDKWRSKRRNRTKIKCARLTNWPRIVARYVRCAKTFLFAVVLAATVMVWL